MINKKLIHFQTLSNFQTQLGNNNISENSIVFIKDAQMIWTHNTYYDCSSIDITKYSTTEELMTILADYALTSDIPTKISQLTNDAGYLTQHQDISNLATKTELSDGLKTKQNTIDDLATIRANASLGASALQSVPFEYVNETELNSALSGKQDVINDLATIRSGAALGATSIQSHQDISHLASKTEVSNAQTAAQNYADEKVAALVNGAPEALDTLDELAAALQDNADIVDVLTESIGTKLSKDEASANYLLKTVAESDYLSKVDAVANYQPKGDYLTEVPAEYVTDTELTNKGYATTSAMNTALAKKQDTISDLTTIRSGAALGATALQSYTETDPVFSASVASGITSSDIDNWNNKTSNIGTITGITMNGASKGTSGVVNLGTVITEHQDISGKLDSTTAASTYLTKTDAASTYLDKTAKAASATTADTATTATNLSAAPSLSASGNNITVTAGGKTSAAFTVPYATSANSAASATKATQDENGNAIASTYATVTSLNGKQDKNLYFTNVAASSWTSSSTYADYTYQCDVACSGVTSSYYAEVVFSVEQVASGNYAPICETMSNVVRIYSKSNTSITIPTIIISL